MKISFVLLIKIQSHHNHNELDRLKNIQLKSFRKFLDLSVLKDFFIVASAQDIQVIKDDLRLSYPEFPFVFVAEEKLCPSLGGCAGWTKQMILKLAVATLVETEYYLTLDTDVFLTKTLSEAGILQEGKLAYQKEAPASHRNWWKSSARALNVAADLMSQREFAMGVTPEYLVTEVCRKLQLEIEALHGTKDFAHWLMTSRMSKKSLANQVIKASCALVPFARALVPRARLERIETCDWTEYSLYWTYLHKLGLTQSYYGEGDRQVYGNCIWAEADLKGVDLGGMVEKAFRDNALYHFSIAQSSIRNLDQARLAQLIGSHLV
jgi:REP element-mobilizing transposase RayT